MTPLEAYLSRLSPMQKAVFVANEIAKRVTPWIPPIGAAVLTVGSAPWITIYRIVKRVRTRERRGR